MDTGLPFALTVGALAFLLGVIWADPWWKFCGGCGAGKQIREGLEQHAHKAGTPTMGGILIILPTLIITLALNLVNVIRTVTGASILLPLVVLIGFAALGAVDDWQGFRRLRGTARQGERPDPAAEDARPDHHRRRGCHHLLVL